MSILKYELRKLMSRDFAFQDHRFRRWFQVEEAKCILANDKPLHAKYLSSLQASSKAKLNIPLNSASSNAQMSETILAPSSATVPGAANLQKNGEITFLLEKIQGAKIYSTMGSCTNL